LFNSDRTSKGWQGFECHGVLPSGWLMMYITIKDITLSIAPTSYCSSISYAVHGSLPEWMSILYADTSGHLQFARCRR
jgi:hypothetical protein